MALESLIRSRDLLKTSLQKSRDIDYGIQTTAAHRRLPSLEADVRSVACKCAVYAVGDHVDRAVAPVSAVMEVYRVVNELGSLLSANSSSDLMPYLSLLKRFQDALDFLANSCKLAILWVEDVLQFLDSVTFEVDDMYRSNVCKTLRILEELSGTQQRSLLKGGIQDFAFGNLENEFENLLIIHSSPLPVPSSLFSSGDDENDTSDPPPEALPFSVVQNLQAIFACFARANRLHNCMSVYVEVRSTMARKTLKGLDLGYLEMSLSNLDSVQEVEGYIDEWGRHLEFIVKHLFKLEYTLCEQVFGQHVGLDYFSRIAVRSGIQDFIKFGNTVTKGTKEAIKLFKLLDIFSWLNSLRKDFNQVFGGRPCLEIQTQTRDLVRKVVNGAYEIFWELSAQVELQRLTDPPPDGKVPRLVSFVTEYSDELLDNDYRPVLEKVLEIHWIWNNSDRFTKGLVSVEVHNIVKSLEVNLQTWAKRYEDAALSYIFMMNTSCYLSKNVKGTKLGDLMGESWLKTHENRVEHFAALYLRETWGKIPALLSDDDITPVSDSRETTRNLAKKRIKAFNEAFDEMHRKQSGWVLCDKGLRRRTCQLIQEVVVPVYKSYMQKYLALVEGGSGANPSPNKYIKYSAEVLENILTSMFQPKLSKYGSGAKSINLIGKIKSAVSDHFSSTQRLQNSYA